MVWWLFRSGKGLLHSAAVKAHRAELAYRETAIAMHGTTHALQQLYTTLQHDAPKPLARNLYRSMSHVERHARKLRRYTLRMREHLQELERDAERAQKQGDKNH